MTFFRFILVAAIHIGCAQADPPLTASPRLALQAIVQGRTLRSNMAIAVPYRIDGDECISVGLIYFPSENRSASIDNWRLCDGRLEKLPGVSPQLSPNHPQMEEVVSWTVQEAASKGQKLSGWGDYEILARRLSEADSKGCKQVESIILIDGLLVSRQVKSVCL